MPYALRRQKLCESLQSKKSDACLVCDPLDIRYLTGASGADACLLVLPKKTFYITDARYSGELENSVSSDVVIKHWEKHMFYTVQLLAKRHTVCRMAFDPRHLTLAQYDILKNACGRSVRLVKFSGLLDGLRRKKSREEVVIIKECLALHKKALYFLKTILTSGMTEREAALRLERFVKRRGADFSFPSIVASGPNSAFPHASVTDREIRRKDPILVDIGIALKGYTSDLTRIFIFDRIPRSFKEDYRAVFAAQRQAISNIRPGVAIGDVARQARNVLKNKGLDKFYIHSLGHGVGLNVHESPRLSVSSKECFEEGMVVTVEPGVYRQGCYGIRIEDMVLVTENGCEVLSESIEAKQPFLIY